MYMYVRYDDAAFLNCFLEPFEPKVSQFMSHASQTLCRYILEDVTTKEMGTGGIWNKKL